MQGESNKSGIKSLIQSIWTEIIEIKQLMNLEVKQIDKQRRDETKIWLDGAPSEGPESED